MNPSARASGAGMYSTPRKVTTSLHGDPFFGADFPDTSLGALPLDLETLGANSEIENPLVTQDPQWTIGDPSAASFNYNDFSVQDDPWYEPLSLGTNATFGARSPYERPPLADGPEIAENVYQLMENDYRMQQQGERLPSFLQPHRTVGQHASDMESANLPCTTEDTSFTDPASNYGSSYHATGMVNDTEHLSSNQNRKRSKDTMKPPQEKPKTPKGTYLSINTSMRARQEADVVGTVPNGRRKAAVEERNGALYVQVSPNYWAPAVYHNDIRAELVAQAPPELYRHLPASGTDELDVTSFYEPHKDWGFGARNERPDVCFEWLSREGSTIENPGYMRHGNLVVLDHFTNKPIEDLPMPTCISSEIDGGRMEAMVRLHGPSIITKAAIRARMPKLVAGRSPRGEGALAMAMTRFRMTAGLPSSNPKDGSVAKKLALVQCIPVAAMEEILVTNSTRSFRDLNSSETAYIEAETRGSRPEKAGYRKLAPADRAQADIKRKRSIRGYVPVNPTAEPFGDDVEDDQAAINAVRARRGMMPVYPPNDDTIGAWDAQPPRNSRECLEQVAKQNQGGSENGAPFKNTLGAHLNSQDIERKRQRSKGVEAPGRHGDVPRSQRRRTNQDVHVARSVSRKVDCANDLQISKEIDSTSLGYRSYALTEMPEHEDIPRISGIPAWPSSTDTSRRIPAIEEHLALPTSFADFEATNESKWCSQRWVDHQPRGHSIQGMNRCSPILDRTATQTEMSLPGSRDYRFKTPDNDEEILTIAIYLQLTIQDISRILPVEPPDIPRDQSYMSQWGLLWDWYVGVCPLYPVPEIWQCTEPWVDGWPSEDMLAGLRLRVGWRQE
ncbi:MAG: hypothetical protein Q9199_002386 [Rusavskia elegans]